MTLSYDEQTVNNCQVTLQFAAEPDPAVRREIARMLVSLALDRLKKTAGDPQYRITAAQIQPNSNH